MKTALEKINEIASKEVSPWLEKALERKRNRGWADRSFKIAVKILLEISRQKPLNGMTQKMLAEEMGVTPQYINKVVKGKENLTLETISKIEQVLGIILFEVPSTETSVIIHVNQGNTYRTVSSKDATYLAKYEVEYSNEYLSESICNYG